MSNIQQFTAVIEREGKQFVALCPELDIASQGDTVEEARRNLKEALELFFETASPGEIRDRLHDEVFVTRLEIAVGNKNMAEIKVFYDKTGNTLTVWFADAEREYVCEETGDEVVLMKDNDGKVIGFEKLNFSIPDPEHLQVALETSPA